MTENTATTYSGLTSLAAAEQQRIHGRNTFSIEGENSVWRELWRSLNNPLLWIVIVAAIISFFVGERVNAIILVLMVTLSVILDTVNTSRSEKAVKLLAKKVVTMTTVIRDGRQQEIPVSEVVPGDLIALSAGDVMPADGQLLEAKDFFVNQSALTGESLPVEKHAGEPQKMHTANDPAMVFLGTSVVTGFAKMKVTAIGKQTSFGAIVGRLAQQSEPTDFEKGLRTFSIFLLRLTVAMVVAVLALNLIAHRPLLDAVLFSIAIAIGMTPELLPVILTVSLSRGAVNMSKRHVIVKHLPAIQNVGRMDILCTDKTGTLTENRIAVMKVIDVAGHDSPDVLRAAIISSMFHTGVTNPIDQAILDYKKINVTQVVKKDELPFDFERRRESVVVEDGGTQWLLTKGAPEAMLPICTLVSLGGESVPMNEIHRRDIDNHFQQLSADGFRVVTVARREYHADHAQPGDEQGMSFLGFVALLDPPKQGVRQTIDALEKMGIEIKILTGDGLALTEKICRDIDCPNKGSMTGEELGRLTTPEEWKTAVESHTIFARIDPEQKEQIIRTLQEAKHVVGFLGDGINDAPALKQADVGISVNNAVDVARETADIILLEHSLEAIRNGIREGRRTFHHTMTYIKMALSSNFGNMFSMTAASAFLPFLPMLPTQVLFNNFLYDASQLSLSTDTVDDQDITRQTSWNFQGLRKFMIIFGLISSVFDILTFYVLYMVTKSNPAIFQTGWFMQSIATQILVLYVLRTRRIPFLQSRPSLALFANTMLMLSIAWILPFIQLGKYFSFTAIPLHLSLMLVGIVLGYLTVVGLAQRLLRKQLHYV